MIYGHKWIESEPVLFGTGSEKTNLLDLQGLFLRQICNASPGGTYQSNCLSSESIKPWTSFQILHVSVYTRNCWYLHNQIYTLKQIGFLVSHSKTHTHKIQPLFSEDGCLVWRANGKHVWVMQLLATTHRINSGEAWFYLKGHSNMITENFSNSHHSSVITWCHSYWS